MCYNVGVISHCLFYDASYYFGSYVEIFRLKNRKKPWWDVVKFASTPNLRNILKITMCDDSFRWFFSIDCIPCFVASGKLELRLFFSCFLDKNLKAWYNGGASIIWGSINHYINIFISSSKKWIYMYLCHVLSEKGLH